MSGEQMIELRLSVFASESPGLYDFVAALPSSRIRRRYALIKLLEAGLVASKHQQPTLVAVPHKTAPIPPASVQSGDEPQWTDLMNDQYVSAKNG